MGDIDSKSGVGNFESISYEIKRVYYYKNRKPVRVDYPMWLNDDERTHLIWDDMGDLHTIPGNWIKLKIDTGHDIKGL